MRAESQKIGDFAHLFDLDFLARLLGDLAGFVNLFFLRLQITIVRMVALQNQLQASHTRKRLAARRFTQDPLRQRQTQIALADTGRTMQQQGMRHAFAVAAQLLKQRLIPGMNHAFVSIAVANTADSC
jgi:hypothetical protein